MRPTAWCGSVGKPLTPEQKAEWLFKERDRLYERARTARPAKFDGLSCEQVSLMDAAQKAHRFAERELARTHPNYQAPPWGDALDD